MWKRLQLMEIHDQAWCPAAVRNGATDCLNLIATVGQQYRNALPLIQRVLQATNSTQVIDLCSGGGGPWLGLTQQSVRAGKPIQVLLTDLYPSETALEMMGRYAAGHIRYLREAVDVTQVPTDLTGFRTLFTAFHHFPPQTAQQILQDTVDRRQGIGIFEQTRREPSAILLMLTLPFIALVVVPFIQPFRWSRLFWTYFIPAIPYVLGIDGVISCLRTYSPEEMEELMRGLDAPGYVWEIGHVPSPLSPLGVSYALLYPSEGA